MCALPIVTAGSAGERRFVPRGVCFVGGGVSGRRVVRTGGGYVHVAWIFVCEHVHPAGRVASGSRYATTRNAVAFRVYRRKKIVAGTACLRWIAEGR
jgi:hypothetical protein